MDAEKGIPAQHIKRLTASPIDPNGFVFEYKDRVYRALDKTASVFYEDLFKKGVIQRLVERHGLVPSEPTELTIDLPAVGLIVEHKRQPFHSYPMEWCSQMLKDAALLTLNILRELADWDATLQDAHPWNITFNGSQPTFTDLTSICPARSNLVWPAYDQFLSFFERPLLLCGMKKGKFVRPLLFSNRKGISREEFFQLADTSYFVKHPFSAVSFRIEARLQKWRPLHSKLNEFIRSSSVEISPAVRKTFVDSLVRSTRRIELDKGRNPWAGYYEGLPRTVDSKMKVDVISNILSRVRPATVVDLGCNTGVFSCLAAKFSSRVISIDSSEECVDRLYAESKRSQLPINPIVSDLICPTPSHGFLGREFPDLLSRARSEMVLCLGLMHHLHLVGRQSFGQIAALLDQLSSRYLLFEFVDKNDDNNVLINSRLQAEYSIDVVLEALGKVFSKIEVMVSDRPSRKLLLCEK